MGDRLEAGLKTIFDHRSGNPDDIAWRSTSCRPYWPRHRSSGGAGATTPDGSATAGADAEAPKQEEVVEADYEIVDDEKKKA
jgi:hypothetical protein